MKRYLLLLIIIGLILPCASAAANYTQVFSTTADTVTVNQSYVIAKTTATPWWFFGGFVILAFGCLFSSYVLSQKQRADLFGYTAPLPFLISALMCTGVSGIEMVTGYGVASSIANCEPIISVFVLLENHTIYINDMVAMFLFIMFIISLINCYRVYMEHELFQQSVGGNSGGLNND
jgi:hypothetical protein